MKKSKILLSSVLTIMLSVSLIMGATFAMFTSKSEVNIAITSGKVEVVATIVDNSIQAYTYDQNLPVTDANYKQFGTPSDKAVEFPITKGVAEFKETDGRGAINVSNFVPGNGIIFDVNIENKGSVDAKYRLQIGITKTDEDETKKPLSEVLTYTVEKDETALAMSKSADGTSYSVWCDLPVTPSGTIDKITTTVEFPLDVDGDEYSAAKAEINFVVYAVQHNAATEDASTSGIGIYNLGDLVALSNNVANGNTYAGETIELLGDIDFGGEAVRTAFTRLASASAKYFSPIGTEGHPFMGTFKGNNHTISGFDLSGANAALFGYTKDATIQDLIIKDAQVNAEGTGTAGLLVANATGSLSLRDITVTDSVVTKEDAATAGALVGKSDNKVTVESVKVQLNEGDSELGNNLSTDLVGSGNVEYVGESEIDFEPSLGFVEKIVKEGESETVSYEVSSANGLRYFAKTVNGTTEEGANANDYSGKTVTLMNEIDLQNEAWTPIGVGGGIPFRGTFDGNNQAIKNLTVYTPTTNEGRYAGLFGEVSGATVKDLTISGLVQIEGVAYIGVISGHGHLTATNITIDASAESYVKTVASKGYVSGSKNDAGAIIGLSNGSTITKVTSNIKVIADGRVGGIVGQSNGDTITEATVTCVVESNSHMSGGIVGTPWSGEITLDNCHFDGTLTSFNPLIKRLKHYGIAGNVDYDDEGRERGTLIANNSSSKLNFADGGFVLEAEWNDTGVVTKHDWKIYNLAGLKTFRDTVNNRDTASVGGTKENFLSYAGETVTLMAEIDLENEEWDPIGGLAYKVTGITDGKYNIANRNFAGTFDGNGQKIKNLKVVSHILPGSILDWGDLSYHDNWQTGMYINLVNPGDYLGFFGQTAGATIKNLTIENVTVNGHASVGALVGNAFTGQIIDCHVTGDINVSGNYQVGGISGGQCYAMISGCSVVGNEDKHGVIEGVYEKANLEGDAIGGIVAYSAEDTSIHVDGCHVQYVDVSGFRKVGGIVGQLGTGNGVTGSSYKNGTVTVTASGEYASANSGKLFAGGIIGEAICGAGYGDKTTITGNTVEDAIINLAELHTYDGIDPAIIGGSRSETFLNKVRVDDSYKDNTVGANVVINQGIRTASDLEKLGENYAELQKLAHPGKLYLFENLTYEGKATGDYNNKLAITTNYEFDLNGKKLTVNSENGYDCFRTKYKANVTDVKYFNGTIEINKLQDGDGCAFFKIYYPNSDATFSFDHVTLIKAQNEWNEGGGKSYLIASGDYSNYVLNNCVVEGNMFIGNGTLNVFDTEIRGGIERGAYGGDKVNFERCEFHNGNDGEIYTIHTSGRINIKDSYVGIDMHLAGDSRSQFVIFGSTIEADFTFPAPSSNRAEGFTITDSTFKGDRHIGSGEGRCRAGLIQGCTFEGNLTIDVAPHERQQVMLDNCHIQGTLTAPATSRVKLQNGTTYESLEGSVDESGN